MKTPARPTPTSAFGEETPLATRRQSIPALKGMTMAVVALFTACLPLTTVAQANWRQVAVPAYTLADYASGVNHWHAAHARQLANDSEQLSQQLSAYCKQTSTLTKTQQQWRRTVTSWDRLSAISIGPVVERRSARQIDFMPVRPEMLERAIVAASAPQSVGAPARGFSALEFLLWGPAWNAPTCHYASALAAHIHNEAQALAHDFAVRAAKPVANEAALAQLEESLNQWVAGIEQLRWAFMRKPLDVSSTHHKAAQYPRQLSGQTRATWLARWSALRETAVLGKRPIPQAGQLIALETLLRSRGLNPLADKLVQTVQRVEATLPGLTVRHAASVRTTTAALAAVSKLVQEELAPALNVRLGFTDADGD